VEDNILTVKATRKMKNEVKKEDYYLCETNFGLISRSFVLPEGIDKEKVDAKYEDGRLYITLEKEESRKAKSIAVK
jgi:HSP20 family protein